MAFSGLGSSESVDVIHREIIQFTQKLNMAEGVWSVFGLFSLGWHVVKVWEETEKRVRAEKENMFVSFVCWQTESLRI